MLAEYCNSFMYCIDWPHEPELLRFATDWCAVSNLEECWVQGISWLAEELIASQALSSIELVAMLCDYEVRHPRCVGSITKNFSCVTHTVEHNYISSSSTVGIQLHVSAVITALGHGTHNWNNEISFPPPNSQYPKRTPHTFCIAALWVKLQPEDGPHTGPKHVVVFLLYY